MKIVEGIDVISAGSFPRSQEWKTACKTVDAAVKAVDWPLGSGEFRINPVKHGNGVKAIKLPCIKYLSELGWETEKLPSFKEGVLTPGDLDALFETPRGYIAFEWETGNIASSHRAMNKLVMALSNEAIKGGFLVLPSDALYPYLTDRIGNIRELRPYLPGWENTPVEDGALRIVVVEHDALDESVPLMKKGTEGRALR